MLIIRMYRSQMFLTLLTHIAHIIIIFYEFRVTFHIKIRDDTCIKDRDRSLNGKYGLGK